MIISDHFKTKTNHLECGRVISNDFGSFRHNSPKFGFELLRARSSSFEQTTREGLRAGFGGSSSFELLRAASSSHHFKQKAQNAFRRYENL